MIAKFRNLLSLAVFVLLGLPALAFAQAPERPGGEANLILPDLSTQAFQGINGRTLLMGGLLVCLLGLAFGMTIFYRLKHMPVHRSMLEVSELIYETCKTYLITQGKFILILELFIGVIMVFYFGVLQHFSPMKVAIILGFSLIGIGGSYGVAWFGIRVNTFANSRAAFAGLRGLPYPIYAIPLQAGMSIGMLLISVELFMMLCILLFIPGDYAGSCFIGFAIGESLGAAALRIAGGIFTKIADIGAVQVQLLVWIFVMRVMMVITSGASYLINEAISKGQYSTAPTMNFEAPLTRLVWLTSILSVVATYIASYLLIPNIGDDPTLWWKLSTIITCGTLAGAIIPELVKIFTSVESSHVKEVVTSSREGGASLNILSGLVAGNFSAYWLGIVIMGLMSVAYLVSRTGLGTLMIAPAVFAFGLVAFGFLGMGPVTIAVDSYGPVTDNAQSVFELSVIESLPNIKQELKRDYGFNVNFERAKHLLEENDGAGNTFKATAKPVLIGTAVVGATTMIFSIIVVSG